MTAHTSDGQQTAVAYLLLFVLLGFYCAFDPLISSIPPWGPAIKLRIVVLLFADFLVLTAVARYLKTWSLLWQLPMQALALVLLMTGMGGLIHALFRNWHLLITPKGLWFGGCFVAAALLGAFMRRMQWRFLDGRHSHLTRVRATPDG